MERSTRAIGCIGKCTTGLTFDELDQITENINTTLSHPRGRAIFRRYLERRNLRSSLDCLELYETCSKFLAEEQHQSKSNDSDIESLIENVKIVWVLAEDIGGIPQIDKALMKRFNEASTGNSRSALLAVLEDTRDGLRDFLERVHGSFAQYAAQPCSLR